MHLPLFKQRSELETTKCVLFHILLDTTNNVGLYLCLLWCDLETLGGDPVLRPGQRVVAVSYTHLTLPTILRV